MSFIKENEQLLAQLQGVDAGEIKRLDVARLIHRFNATNERLKQMLDQANAQFKAGDRHATFSKQTIQAMEEPLYHGKPKTKYLWNPT